MPLETGTYIEDLNEAWPLGSDPVSQGDDHTRLVKETLKNSFRNTTGPWNTTSPITHGAATADAESAILGQVPKIASGMIDINGNIQGGSGNFTVQRTQQGVYNITFNDAAPSQYEQTIVASADNQRIVGFCLCTCHDR